MIRPPANAAALLDLVAAAGYLVFEAGPFDLNLVALRAIPGTVDAFDDLLCVAYADTSGTWRLEAWPCTTDPGRPSLENPRRADGTAIIIPGQHRAAYMLGSHKGRYPCLVPTRPIPVWRDGNRDAVVDYWNGSSSSSSAVQIHHASALRAVARVGPWSEGCIVLQRAADLRALVELVRLQAAYRRCNTVTLSLIEVRET